MKKDQDDQKKMQGNKNQAQTSLKSKTNRPGGKNKGSKTEGSISANAKREQEFADATIRNTVKEKLLDDPDL